MVGPNDVLLGRDAPPTDMSHYHPGNAQYRRLIAQRRGEYAVAKTRDHKHRIAGEILDALQEQNARFLVRVDEESLSLDRVVGGESMEGST
jgi:hypothetical protein